MEMVRLPASCIRGVAERSGATPSPPPTSTTVPLMLADVAGQAERADKIEDRVAFAQRQHLEGGLADRLNHHRDGAGFALKSATVSGMRSPCSSMRAMTKWPGRAARATSGACDFPQEGGGAELHPALDEKHNTP